MALGDNKYYCCVKLFPLILLFSSYYILHSVKDVQDLI